MRRILGIGFVALFVLAACGKSNNGAGAGGSSQSAGGGGTVALTVNTANVSGIGTVLVDGNGLTLYYLKGESASNIQCTGGCLSTWPPLLFSGSGTPAGGTHVTGTLATVNRPDGKGTQVTYNGLPLYTFAGDTAGKASGQGVANFYAVTPSTSASGSSSGGRYGGGSSPSSSGGY